MTGIRQAVEGLEQAEKRARAIIAAARLTLGHEIVKARANDVPQKAIAAELNLTREQVRRLEVAARNAAETETEQSALDAPGAPPPAPTVYLDAKRPDVPSWL